MDHSLREIIREVRAQYDQEIADLQDQSDDLKTWLATYDSHNESSFNVYGLPVSVWKYIEVLLCLRTCVWSKV